MFLLLLMKRDPIKQKSWLSHVTEIEKGCSNLYAVKMGFESAFATITDSNVTTLIAAFLLYTFGVGAIKGFAVTLTIGIIASMYTALVVTKLMIDIWLKYGKPKSLGL